MHDNIRLRIIKTGVVLMMLGLLLLASQENAHIYELVASAYSVTLVAGFAPLAFGLYSKRVNSFDAFTSIISGIAVWQITEMIGTSVLPTFIGFFASILGMILGTFIGNLTRKKEAKEDALIQRAS